MEKIEEQSQLKKSRSPKTFYLVWGYYIATPAFIILELLFGFGFRVPFILAAPVIRYLYYAVCIACGVICHFRPKAAPYVAFAESVIYLTLIIVGYGAAVSDAMLKVAELKSVPEILSIKGTLSFIVPATVGLISFYHCQEVVDRIIKKKMRYG